MKTKLTLTVQDEIIEKAKKKAKKKGISLSKLFEETILEKEAEEEKREERRRAIEKFIKSMEGQTPTKALPQSDKELWHQHLDEKYG